MNNDRLQGIAFALAQEGLLNQTNAIEYQKLAFKKQMSIVQYLAHEEILTPSCIAKVISKNFGLPLINLDCLLFESLSIGLINEKLLRFHRTIPLFTRGSQLFVAIEDPSNQTAINEIQFHTGLAIYPILAETDKLTNLLNKLLYQAENQNLQNYFEQIEPIADIEPNANEDAPIIKFVNRMIVDAIHKGASDIHFETYDHQFRIRYRQDGLLHEVNSSNPHLSSRVVARLKIMANLDTTERRMPQDGRFKMQFDTTKSIDFRINTCPTVYGEKIVIRILDKETTKIGIEMLGFNANQQKCFIDAIHRPQGMILVTGPTGSGKTVTLYSALHILNSTHVNISTVEDPVEIKIPGINQVNINPKAGLYFSDVLRAFLRQDPDIIMLGEIRDLETAEIAIKASQTGHLVLSTLHTNSASETLSRLVNMGVQPFNIASSISLIIAQRLVRKLCAFCKVKRDDSTSRHFIEFGPSYEAVGCKNCTQGYRGRMGLFEVLPMSNALEQLILHGGNSMDILKLAQSEGMLTIYQSGLEKIRAGLTTIEEINRVIMD